MPPHAAGMHVMMPVAAVRICRGHLSPTYCIIGAHAIQPSSCAKRSAGFWCSEGEPSLMGGQEGAGSHRANQTQNRRNQINERWDRSGVTVCVCNVRSCASDVSDPGEPLARCVVRSRSNAASVPRRLPRASHSCLASCCAIAQGTIDQMSLRRPLAPPVGVSSGPRDSSPASPSPRRACVSQNPCKELVVVSLTPVLLYGRSEDSLP